MKSYGTFLLGLYDALFEDLALWYPEGATEWRRTQARLRSLVKTRGLRYLTIDLVSAGKHFDQCLERGSFEPSNIAGFAIRPGEAIPRLFGGLLLRVFTKRSKLRRDADVAAIGFLRQLFFAAKKIRMECHDSATFETVAEYFSIEKECRSPTLNWVGDLLFDPDVPFPPIHIGDEDIGGQAGAHARRDVVRVPEARLPLGDLAAESTPIGCRYPGLLSTIQRVADLVVSDLGQLNPSEILPRHGPGAVSDRKGESKYDFPYWSNKLQGLFDSAHFAFYNGASIFIDEDDGGPTLSRGEPPSKLTAVPKTQKAPRLIASEPTAHQWIQQGVCSSLEERMAGSLLKNCISFGDQNPSRNLALEASSHRQASTVDLSSASDRLTCWLVERMFRSNLSILTAFHACRTRWLVNTKDKKRPKYTILRKFSTMGSALTFPVQSIVYALVCIGVDIWFRNSQITGELRHPITDSSRISSRLFRSEVEKSSKRTRVYGDDLIVPVESTALLVEVLTYLGLKVNPHKTFTASFFRESCGIDAYHGVEVTPCYVNEIPNETEPASLVSVMESANNFFERGLWRSSLYLERSLPRWFRKGLPVKKVGSGAFGLISYVGADVTHLVTRWNDQLHHEEYVAYSAFTKQKKRRIRGSAALLQYFTEHPLPTTKWGHGVGLRALPQLRKRGFPTYLLQ